MRRYSRIVLLSLCTIASGKALAFGTISMADQDREHERITRHALACGLAGAGVTCFEPKSIDELAGAAPSFGGGIRWGAVGAPDNPVRMLIMTSDAHCDNGDALPTAGYPPPKEPDALLRCRRWMWNHVDSAAGYAAKLVAHGAIDDAEIPTMISCTYLGLKGPGSRAKCNVLEDFGLTLHAAQDFYAHTNWTDAKLAGQGAPSNAPGLGNLGAAPWLDLHNPMVPPPPGVISGCFVFKPEPAFCNDGAGSDPRVKHMWMNKDHGIIDPVLGAGLSPRGAVGDNFKRAVQGAIEDTRNKWAFLQEQIIARYGAGPGRLMICAITHDDPKKTCAQAQQNDALKFNIRNTTGLLGLLLMFMLAQIFGRDGVSRLRAGASRAMQRIVMLRKFRRFNLKTADEQSKSRLSY